MLQEDESVGRRVRRQRLRLGMAQADLAAAMRCTQGWVSKVENGKVELDRASVINELAAALHCHPNDLLARPYPVKGERTSHLGIASTASRGERRTGRQRRGSQAPHRACPRDEYADGCLPGCSGA